MQDRETGEMVPVASGEQADLDQAIPDRSRQGVLLAVGEKVDIAGGHFCIQSIGRKMLVLRGLPGTSITQIKTNCVPSLITFGATKIFLRRNIQTGSGSNAPPSAGRGE